MESCLIGTHTTSSYIYGRHLVSGEDVSLTFILHLISELSYTKCENEQPEM